MAHVIFSPGNSQIRIDLFSSLSFLVCVLECNYMYHQFGQFVSTAEDKKRDQSRSDENRVYQTPWTSPWTDCVVGGEDLR